MFSFIMIKILYSRIYYLMKNVFNVLVWFFKPQFILIFLYKCSFIEKFMINWRPYLIRFYFTIKICKLVVISMHSEFTSVEFFDTIYKSKHIVITAVLTNGTYSLVSFVSGAAVQTTALWILEALSTSKIFSQLL